MKRVLSRKLPAPHQIAMGIIAALALLVVLDVIWYLQNADTATTNAVQVPVLLFAGALRWAYRAACRSIDR